MKKRNAKIRKMANRVHLAGTVILMTCVMASTYLYLTEQAQVKGVLGIAFTGLVAFIFLRGAAWLIGGFEQKTKPREKPAGSEEGEIDPTTGSRFLHTKEGAVLPTKNPFIPD